MNSTTPDAYTNSTTPSPNLTEYLEMWVFTFNFVFGLLTHSYVIRLIVTGTRSKIASEYFILNLSVCEIGNCVNSLFYILSNVFSCLLTLVTFLQGLAVTGHPLFQSLICVERYLAVVHPVTFLKYKPLRYRVICSTAAWIIALRACLFCMFILNPLNLKAYTLIFSLQFLLFLSIQMFCLVVVLRALKQSRPGERKREKEGEKHMKRRAFNVILISTMNVTITHVPYVIISLTTILTLYFTKVG